MASDGGYRLVVLACLSILLLPSPAIAHPGDGTEGPCGLQGVKDAGEAPEDANPFARGTLVCQGHLVPGSDEVDLWQDQLPALPEATISLHVHNTPDGTPGTAWPVLDTLVIRFEAFWGEPGSMTSLGSIDLENDSEDVLSVTVPTGATSDGRLFLAVSLVEISDPTFGEVGYDFR